MMLEWARIMKRKKHVDTGQNLLTGILRPSHKSLMRAQE